MAPKDCNVAVSWASGVDAGNARVRRAFEKYRSRASAPPAEHPEELSSTERTADLAAEEEECAGCCASTEASLEEVRSSLKVLLERRERAQSRERCDDGDDDDDDGGDQKDGGGEKSREVELTCAHMDGLEVYAVVSALTVATSLSIAEAYRHDSDSHGWMEMYQDGLYIELVCRSVFIFFTAVSALLGLHATLVYSLITMYGRTAVGMDNMPAFKSFYSATAGQRHRGFRSFLFSIYAFLAQIVLIVTAKCPEHNVLYPLVGFALTSAAVLQIYQDTEKIVGEAGIIFVPKKDRLMGI